MLNKSRKAYQEIFDVLKKHSKDIVFNVEDLKTKADHHLFGLELKEKYKLNINPDDIHSLTWINLGQNINLGLYGTIHNRKISWPDNDEQPENELLLQICYPTGAYIFGEDYPTNFFERFFMELKSYNPKYCDSHNKNLYFSLDNAYKIFNEYNDIVKRYAEENRVDIKKRKIQKLKDELNNLESNK